ncbi:MAG: hypothetical protein C3L24_01925, partial [Candidatus Sedimenticola endophacoides]
LQCAGRSRDERRTVGAVTAVALASRFWGLGCPKIFHEVATLLVTGVLAANLFGRSLVALWERLLARIPLVRSVYSGAKQLAETMFSDAGESFRKVLLVEFPRKGVWTLAFLTGTEMGEAQRKTGRQVVYVPTTPNPTGGYFVMLPREDVVELEMSVDDGLKMLMSMGAVVPDAARVSGAGPVRDD